MADLLSQLLVAPNSGLYVSGTKTFPAATSLDVQGKAGQRYVAAGARAQFIVVSHPPLSGTLQFFGGSTTVAGSLNASGAFVLAVPPRISACRTFSAAGTLSVSGGNVSFVSGSNAQLQSGLSVSGGSLWFHASLNPALPAGTSLTGGSLLLPGPFTAVALAVSGGNHSFTTNGTIGNLTWTGGSLVTPATLSVSSSFALGGSGTWMSLYGGGRLAVAQSGTW